jgi:hypothetical protein
MLDHRPNGNVTDNRRTERPEAESVPIASLDEPQRNCGIQ